MKVYIDSAVCAFVCFMIFLATFNYFKIGYPLYIILSITLAIIVFALFFIIKNKKYKRFKFSQKENKKLKNFIDYLRVKNHQELLQEFILFMQKAGYMPEKSKNCIVLEQKKCYVYLLFKFDNVSCDDIITLKKQTPIGYKSVIICTNLADTALTLTKLLVEELEMVSCEKVFDFLNKNELLPKCEYNLTPKKIKLKILLKECFSRSRCTHFFYIGTIMLVFSLFVFYPKYYLIMGTIFCTYGLICLFYGKKTT